MKTTTATIHLHLIEEIDRDYVEASAPRGGRNSGTFTPARQALAECFGFDKSRTPESIPAADGGDCGSCDLAKLDQRIHDIAARHMATVERIKPLHWVVTRTTPEPCATYEFPAGTFSGCDQTKWGPTDFYEGTREGILAALRSGLDFETPWLSCKKEILSSRITRSKGITTVEVSVSDDFDTPGMGAASARIPVHAKVSDDSILRSVEKLGAKAHEESDNDRHTNADYVGYSVGPNKKPYPWVMTYLVNVGGCDTPSGDNYHWWGWQEVETDEDDNPNPLPEPDKIPAEVAEHLAKGMEQLKPVVIYKGYRATAWKE